ncbi:hypothetical protein [Mycobacterium asiaticum]|uniref:hypothetical protein n=1 Tax=Mycobacterium asiaticum TaxID=1790 RepID=UPI0007EF39BE|nr:hypothetical protein [Mycobacterium asiaticum]OBJ53721.1 hypothetical protein A9W94_22695 [Mycobacterium asiaticum]
MTAAELRAAEPLTAAQARALTDAIKDLAGVLWDKIDRAYNGRAWAALGYPGWDSYCIKEFTSLRLRIPREERTEVVHSLRHAGLSVRAIASATGLGRGTVHRELESPVPASTTDDDADALAEKLIETEDGSITGTDGKRYPPKINLKVGDKPKAPRAEPFKLAVRDANPRKVIHSGPPPIRPRNTEVVDLNSRSKPPPSAHAIIGARIAAKSAKRNAASIRSLVSAATISDKDAADLRAIITAAINDLHESLQHIDRR